MKAKELRKKSETELLKLLQDKRSQVVNFKINISSGNVTNVREIRQTKKDIARIQTVLNARDGEDEK
ncbi:MAG: 50S ribosomal protein L29 [Candidatus Spechtbacterales bacterium]|nr:50S ribosomal protein L29 [Candidatus Spechtbacterales bacterium]